MPDWEMLQDRMVGVLRCELGLVAGLLVGGWFEVTTKPISPTKPWATCLICHVTMRVGARQVASVFRYPKLGIANGRTAEGLSAWGERFARGCVTELMMSVQKARKGVPR